MGERGRDALPTLDSHCCTPAGLYGAFLGQVFPHILCFSSSQSVCGGILCHVRLLATPRIIACQAPLSIRFFRQEYWSGLLFPTPGDLPDSGIELKSLVAPALAGRFFTSAPSGNPTPLRSTWIIVFYANFLSCFAVAKKTPPTKWKRLATWWPWALSPRPLRVWGLKVNPVTPPCALAISQPGNRARADQVPCDPFCSLIQLLNMLSEILWEAQIFLEQETPRFPCMTLQ